MISETHGRLRAATRAVHDHLESCVDLLGACSTPEGRRALVIRFHRLHAEAEAAIAPWLSDLEGLEFEARRRTARLAHDLAVVGGRPEAPDPVTVGSVEEALGRMYVLEGSTLVGQVIRRELARRGDGMEGLSFLDPYGARVGERWRTFMALLDGAIRTEAAQAAVVAGALAGFGHAERRLCRATAVV